MKSGLWLNRAAIVLLAVLWCCTAYRAKTQSISIDEAFTYDRYVSKSVEDMMAADYDANNHVLYTILAQVSVACFGNSELSLRIPALLGGLIFFAALFLLARILLPVPWIRFLVICLVSLNPFVLDFLCIARGYGLANGLFLLSVYLILSRKPMWLAGVFLGLAVGANFTFLFPGLALVAVLAWQLVRQRGGKQLLGFVVTAAAVATLIVGVPLSHGDPSSFYFGAPTAAVSLRSMLDISLAREHSPLREFGLAFGTLLAPVAVGLVFVIARWSLSNLVCGVFVVALFGLFLAHSLFGILYPYRRTGLYLVILFVLACGAALQALELTRFRRAARGLTFLIAAPALVLFLAQTNLRMYGEWPFDENFAGLVQRLIQEHARQPAAKASVGVSQLYGFQLAYYVRTRKLDWVRFADFGFTEQHYDYYLLMPTDRGLLQNRKLRVLYTDPHSYAILAGS